VNMIDDTEIKINIASLGVCLFLAVSGVVGFTRYITSGPAVRRSTQRGAALFSPKLR